MNKRSKRIQTAEKKIEKKLYKANEALDLLKNIATAKFNETAEAHIVLGIDPKYNDQKLRATVNLPKGTGKKITLAVITKTEPEDIKKLGADIVGEAGYAAAVEYLVAVFRLAAGGAFNHGGGGDITKDKMAVAVAPVVLWRGQFGVNHQHAIGGTGCYHFIGALQGKGCR